MYETDVGASQTFSTLPANARHMARQVTDQIPIKPETKDVIRERKPDGVTYDHYVRQLMGLEQ